MLYDLAGVSEGIIRLRGEAGMKGQGEAGTMISNYGVKR